MANNYDQAFGIHSDTKTQFRDPLPEIGNDNSCAAGDKPGTI